MTVPRPGWRPLALLLAGAGVLHFVTPKPYTRIVPRRLGDPLPWVYASGAAEVACAAGLAHPRTRRLAGLATAALFVAVFPANITMASRMSRSSRSSSAAKAVSVARLPLQGPLVWWALDVARQDREPHR